MNRDLRLLLFLVVTIVALLGAIAVVMMLVAPQGIWGLLKQRFKWELFPAHRVMSVRDLPGAQPSTSVEEAQV